MQVFLKPFQNSFSVSRSSSPCFEFSRLRNANPECSTSPSGLLTSIDEDEPCKPVPSLSAASVSLLSFTSGVSAGSASDECFASVSFATPDWRSKCKRPIVVRILASEANETPMNSNLSKRKQDPIWTQDCQLPPRRSRSKERRKAIPISSDESKDSIDNYLLENLEFNPKYSSLAKSERLDELLCNHVHLKTLPGAVRDGLFREFFLKSYKPNELILSNPKSDSFMVIDHGTCVDSQQQVYTEGSTIGNASLIIEAPIPLHLRAADQVDVWRIEGAVFRPLLKRLYEELHRRRSALLSTIQVSGVNLLNLLRRDLVESISLKKGDELSLAKLSDLDDVNFFMVDDGSFENIEPSSLAFAVGHCFSLANTIGSSRFEFHLPVYNKLVCLSERGSVLVFRDIE